MLWGKYVSPTIRRYITLTVASICMATAGSLFTFSVLASSFTSNLGYTGWDLNIISGVGNTALYVTFLGIGPMYDVFGARITYLFAAVIYTLGYLLMFSGYNRQVNASAGAMSFYYFLAGTGACASYMAAIGINLNNFTLESSGKVTGFLLLFYGISGTIYSQVYSKFYTSNTSSYLAFLTLTVGLSNGLGFLLSTDSGPPMETGILPIGDDSAKTDDIVKTSKKLTSSHSIPELFIATPSRNSVGHRASIKAIVKPDDDFFRVSIRDSAPGDGDDEITCDENAKGPGEARKTCVLQQQSEEVVVKRLSISTAAAVSDMKSARASGVTAAASNFNSAQSSAAIRLSSDSKSSRPSASLPPLLILKSPIFWLYCSVCVFQQGLTYMSNMSLIISAISSPTDLSPDDLASKTTLHLTLLSVFQSLGRFSFGLLSDLFKTATWGPFPADCTWLLIIAQMLIFLPVLLLGFGGISGNGAVTESVLLFSSISMGFGFGAAGACFPVLTRDYFGMRYYGTACGFLMGAVPIGLLLSNTIFGILYDKALAATGGGTQCYSQSCFSTSFVIFSFIQLVPCVNSVLLLVLRTREKTARL